MGISANPMFPKLNLSNQLNNILDSKSFKTISMNNTKSLISFSQNSVGNDKSDTNKHDDKISDKENLLTNNLKENKDSISIEKLNNMNIYELRKLAKNMNIEKITNYTKENLINKIISINSENNN